MSGENGQEKKRSFSMWKAIAIITGLLAAAGLSISAANFTLIAKSYLHPDQVPTIMGVAPLIVLSGSMAPTIQCDDVIFVGKTNPEALKEGDIIACQIREGRNVVTHRIIEIGEEDGARVFITKGDANAAADADAVYADQVVGKYFYRFKSAGAGVIFLSSPLGSILLIIFNVTTLSVLLVSILIYFSKRKQKRNKQIAA